MEPTVWKPCVTEMESSRCKRSGACPCSLAVSGRPLSFLESVFQMCLTMLCISFSFSPTHPQFVPVEHSPEMLKDTGDSQVGCSRTSWTRCFWLIRAEKGQWWWGAALGNPPVMSALGHWNIELWQKEYLFLLS